MASSKTAMISLDQFQVEGKIDVNDVLSIVTSRADEKYNAELSRCKKEAKSLEKEIADLTAEINKDLEAELKNEYEEVLSGLADNLKVVDGGVQIYSARLSYDKKQIDGELGIGRKDSKGKISNGAIFPVKVKPSSAISKKVKDLASLEEKLAGLMDEAVSWRKRIGNIPALERKSRARIVTAKLASSEEGQKVLDLLAQNIEDDILMLPG